MSDMKYANSKFPQIDHDLYVKELNEKNKKLQKENTQLKEEIQHLRELSCDDKTTLVIRAYKMALKKTLHYLYLKCKNKKEFIEMWGREYWLLGELDTLLEEWNIQNVISELNKFERPTEEQEKLFKEYYWNQKIRGRTMEDRIKERMKEIETDLQIQTNKNTPRMYRRR